MRNNENILIKKNENTHSIIAEVKVFNALYILKEKGRRVKISAFTITRQATV